MRVLLFASFFVIAMFPANVFAQEPPQLPPVEYNQVLSANLLGFVAQWFNVEYERKVAAATTVGVSGSTFRMFEGRTHRATAFVRFYPQRGALSGVFIGFRGGVVWDGPMRADESAIATGIEIGRTRLLGPDKNIAISTGFGLDRVFYHNGSFAIPNLRLFNIGIAF